MNKRQAAQDKRVLDMRAAEAREFFLKSESYCNFDLPHYFDFGRLLSDISQVVLGKQLSKMTERPRDCEDVNYMMLSNKDGRHAWRPLQLIHPVLYVSLVEQITTPNRWRQIGNRFKMFQKGVVQCVSIPAQASVAPKDKAAQIRRWWQSIEQRSIELSLEYNYMFHTDIADCYAAIYTHSIAWAMHGKPTAKKNRGNKRNLKNKRNPKEELIGNVIDWHIQDMRNGQTNGIPQGSVLMDLICEIVLGYADLELTRSLREKYEENEYYILRYRDDYRIFVNSPQIGEAILKALTEVLIDLGLKLNPAKTAASHQVVADSLKPDKRAWLRSKQNDRNPQKHLLLIHAHGIDFPGAGSLKDALTLFYRRLKHMRQISNPRVLISIVTDVAYTSPNTFPLCAAIISKLLDVLDTDQERIDVIEKIHSKLSQFPNTGHMEIWLQRISHLWDPKYKYGESLCKVMQDKTVSIWNNKWVTDAQLKAAVDPSKIIDKDKRGKLKTVVELMEVELFLHERY